MSYFRHLLLATTLLLWSLFGFTQDKFGYTPGMFELGVRSTASVFSHDGYPGLGTGGQFRIRINEYISTEWFTDYITTNIGGVGRRQDAHIGWSVMFYPLENRDQIVVPYILAGHCFDYTRVNSYHNFFFPPTEPAERWSSAIQMGLGTHFNLTKRLDLSLAAQYMAHLGNDIHTDIHQSVGPWGEMEYLVIEEHEGGFSLEGHLLITLSLNVKLGRLWQK